MFSSFFILILAFPWLLISYIHFTKWTPAFSLGGSVNQLNGQAEPHVIMVRVLHLFKIQVSLTEQSCLIHIFFVSWIKDFSSPSCWSLWEGYTTHSWAQNFWLPLPGTVAGAGGGGSRGEAKQHPGGRATVRVLWVSVLLLPCCWCHGLLPGQGQRMESMQKRAARGGFASVMSHGFTPGRLCCCPLEKSSVWGRLSQARSVTSPCSQPCPVFPEQGSHRFLGAVPLRACSSFLSCSRAGLYLLLGTW